MINIRQASKDEVKNLQDLNDEIFIDNQKYDIDLDMNWAQSNKGRDYFTNLLNNSDACCLVAEENDKLVGYISGAEKKFSYRKSRYFEIENMGVNPDYRSKGIGSLLMKKFLEWAKSNGYEKVYVSSYFANNKAVEFYKRNGFSEIDLNLERKI